MYLCAQYWKKFVVKSVRKVGNNDIYQSLFRRIGNPTTKVKEIGSKTILKYKALPKKAIPTKKVATVLQMFRYMKENKSRAQGALSLMDRLITIDTFFVEGFNPGSLSLSAVSSFG